jgi:hypothetical protein
MGARGLQLGAARNSPRKREPERTEPGPRRDDRLIISFERVQHIPHRNRNTWLKQRRFIVSLPTFPNKARAAHWLKMLADSTVRSPVAMGKQVIGEKSA